MEDKDESIFKGCDDGGRRAVPGGGHEGSLNVEETRGEEKSGEQDTMLMSGPDMKGC